MVWVLALHWDLGWGAGAAHANGASDGADSFNLSKWPYKSPY